MHNGVLHACQAVEGATDEVLTRLGNDLDCDAMRNTIRFNQEAHKVEVGLRRRGETDLDLFETHCD